MIVEERGLVQRHGAFMQRSAAQLLENWTNSMIFQPFDFGGNT
jgi:hypothetical protein